jgi:hypothetical protein
MATLTRTKVLVIAIAILVGFAVWPHGGQAASGGTTKNVTSDTTITSTASNVTVSNAFPDGNTTAQCFISINQKSGVQSPTYGNCSGLSATVTCASGQYDLSVLAPSGVGASTSINGTPTWNGVYDQGASPPCTNTPAGAKASLMADVAGTAAGQNVVFLWTTSNSGHFNVAGSAERSGCVQYLETSGTSTPGCFILNYKTGPGAGYYEATAQGATGTVYESPNAGNTPYPDRADMTLSGVFVEAPGQAAVPTNTPGGPTNTPLPATATPTPGPGATLGARLVQFAADSTLTSTSSGVTSSQVFPDGGTQAACFVKVTSNTGAQSQTYGNCAGYTVTMSCASGSFPYMNFPPHSGDQHGAAINLPTMPEVLSGAYDKGPVCTNVPLPGHTAATLTVDVSGLTAGTKVAFWYNNDNGGTVRNGCVSFKDAAGAFSVPGCFQNNQKSLNGAYYEVAATGATGTGYQYKGTSVTPPNGSPGPCPGGCYASGNLTLGGVYIGLTGGGLPLAAQYVGVSHAHGLNIVHWYSPLTVQGFNVLSGKTQLNKHLVTGANGWYRFSTRHAIRNLHLIPVRG